MSLFASSIGRCEIAYGSVVAWQWDEFSKLTGVQASLSATDSPEVTIQNFGDASAPLLDETVIFSGKNHRFIYNLREKNFRICNDVISPVRLWQFGLFCSGLAMTMRHGNCMMMHGALLEMPDGSGVVLCGPSGMGKSTTARRWKAAGGVCYADDLLWIVWGEDGITAYPLPTWSRCLKSLEGEYFPLNHGIPLKAVLALSRGKERESLEAMPPVQYQYTVYGSAIFYEQEFIPCLPSPDKEELMKIIKRNTLKLLEAYPPVGLYATLDGDLRATLAKFL